MINFLKTYSVNFLSLLNIIFSFVFTLLFAMFYKVSSIADAYFFSLIVFSNIFLVIQLFYSTFFNIYLHIENEREKNNLYYMLLFILLFVSIAVIGLYFIITTTFHILSDDVRNYLDIYIYTLLFAPLIGITIQLMNAKKEFYYAYYYPIGRNVMALLLLLVYTEQSSLTFLAYAFLFYDFLFFVLLFTRAMKLLGVRPLYFDKANFIKIFQKSFLDKTGQFFLGLPELFISNILVSSFPGILSIYSYVKKFTVSLIQFIFTPQLTIFATNISQYLKRTKEAAVLLAIKKLWVKTLPFYLLSSVVLAIAIKYILAIFLSSTYVEENLLNIYIVYIILFVQNIFIILEYPYGTVINQKLYFGYALKVKLLAFIIFICLLFLYKTFFDNLYMLLSLFIPSAIFMLITYRYKTLHLLDDWRSQ